MNLSIHIMPNFGYLYILYPFRVHSSLWALIWGFKRSPIIVNQNNSFTTFHLKNTKGLLKANPSSFFMSSIFKCIGLVRMSVFFSEYIQGFWHCYKGLHCRWIHFHVPWWEVQFFYLILREDTKYMPIRNVPSSYLKVLDSTVFRSW